jgi:hypothetical protein
MAILYGDSTLFPYEEDFIEISKDLIECCASLFSIQHVIATSLSNMRERELHRRTESQKLAALLDATHHATATATGERACKISGQVFEAAKAVIDREVADLEAQTTQEIAASRAAGEEAKQGTHHIVEAFLLRHDLHKTLSELRIIATEKGYAAKTWVVTPFGVEALFSVAIPPQNDWNKLRRVGDLSVGVEVQMPLSAGWISKRIELQPVRLDKLVISELSISEEKTTVSLRKTATAGGGYLLEIFSASPPKVTIATLGEDGLPTETARTLSGDDHDHVLRLWSKLISSTAGIERRQAMLSATVNKKPLHENDMPEAIGLRLIQILTPILTEIVKRSLAPGELILRRDLGEGRREEIYATKAELYEKIKGLPEPFQLLFAPLELSKSLKTPLSGSGLLRMEQDIKQQPQGPIPSGQAVIVSLPVLHNTSPPPVPNRNTPTSSPSGQKPTLTPIRQTSAYSPSGRAKPGATTIFPASLPINSVPPVAPSNVSKKVPVQSFDDDEFLEIDEESTKIR